MTYPHTACNLQGRIGAVGKVDVSLQLCNLYLDWATHFANEGQGRTLKETLTRTTYSYLSGKAVIAEGLMNNSAWCLTMLCTVPVLHDIGQPTVGPVGTSWHHPLDQLAPAPV